MKKKKPLFRPRVTIVELAIIYMFIKVTSENNLLNAWGFIALMIPFTIYLWKFVAWSMKD